MGIGRLYRTPSGVLASQSILDAVRTPVFSVDREFRYLAFNRAHADVMSALYGSEIAVGVSLLDCQSVQPDREGAKAALERVFSGEEVTVSSWSGEEDARRHYTITHAPIVAEGEVVGATIVAVDTTDQALAEDRAARLQQELIDAVASPMHAIDTDFKLTAFNQAFAEGMLRVYGLAIRVGESVLDLFPEGTDRDLICDRYSKAMQGEPVTDAAWFGGAESRRYYASTMSPIVEDDDVVGVVVVSIDRTTAALAEAQLREQATHDPLTGLPNRRALENAVSRAIAMAARGTESVLLFVDVDDFKKCNDRFGHMYGDRVLKDIGTALTKVIRETDLVARVGGDEFGVLLWERSDGDATEVSERLNEAVEGLAGNLGIDLSLSIGAARVTAESTMFDVLDAADLAMYHAKGNGLGARLHEP